MLVIFDVKIKIIIKSVNATPKCPLFPQRQNVPF